MEKTLPHNETAERATLGAILLDREAVVPIAAWLQPEHFYVEKHAWIYEAQLSCYNRRTPPDLTTVADELRRTERLEQIGGVPFLVDLSNSVPTSFHVEYYARIVERTAVLRRLIRAGGKIAALGFDETDDVEQTLDAAEQELFNVSQRRGLQGFVPLSAVVDQYYEYLSEMQERGPEMVGLSTGFIDFDRMTGGLHKSDLLILAARPGVGKCLPSWTLIDDPETGARRTIAECVAQQQSRIYGISETGAVRETAVSAWLNNGTKPCYRLRTRSGRVIDATDNHPFLTVDGWTPLRELAPGQAIAVPKAVPAFGKNEDLPIELVRLIAYFIAEGGLTGSSPHFTNADPVIVEDFKQIIAQHFPTCAVRQHGISYAVARPGRGGVPTPNPVAQWLGELNLWGKKSTVKSFPACVWTWSKRYLAEFLRALMSCDGSIYASESGPRIEFSVASQQLAADVHHAFIRFGIVARLYKTSHNAWRVAVTDSEAVLRYQEQIGWIGEKTTRFPDFTRDLAARHSNVGHAPKETWQIVRAACQEQAVSLSELARKSGETTRTGKYAGYNPHTNRTIPHIRLAKYAEVLNHSQLRRASSADIFWDQIVAIEPIGEHRVYDLTVPNGENFIAQDIIVHNSSFAMTIAFNMAMQQRTPVGVFALEMGRDQLLQRLLATHTNIDSQKLRTGRISTTELTVLMDAMGQLSSAPIYIDDTPGVTVTEVRAKARRLQAEHGLEVLIIDYLQLMSGSGKRGDNRVQEVSEISRSLKALARELNIPVIALSQLSRAVEGRTSHVPVLADLRESGCLTGDTLVYLPDLGIHRRIDQLMGQQGFNVLALNTETWQLEPCSVTHAFSTGRKPVYRLTTALGRTIRATANHKFLTIAGWQRLDELGVGTRLALPRQLPDTVQASMSDAELALLGHLIGDGCTLPRHVIQYTTNDQTLAEIVAQLATQIFGDAVAPKISQERDWLQVYLTATARLTHNVRNPIATWLDQLGIFGLRSYEKFVPDQVFAQPNSGIACFLRHLWATDGCIRLGTTSHSQPAIYYASSSKRLAQDVQALLLRLEINATLHRVSQKGKGRDQYHVVVDGKAEITRFLQQVGAVGQSKVVHRDAILSYLEERAANTNRDVVPREIWRQVVVPAIQTVGMTGRQMQAALGNASCGTGLYKQNISRARTTRLADVVQSTELHNLAHSDVYWDQIVEITPDGEEDVYDLTVEGLHNFVANNIVVHNSIEQDADIVMFIYREEMYDKDTDKKGIAEIHIAKHRNGPLGVVPLFFDQRTTRFQNLAPFQSPDGY
ncbi:MAG: replicative DNA helicase [Chloroflexi bacterium]|nr:replicative DNA helicase [Chloroflexota bacterium]